MDKTDHRIISCMVADARSSFADIGAKVGLSAPAVKRRVDRLLDLGVLRGFTAVVDPEALGWGTEAFVEVYCHGNVTPGQIRVGLEPLAEVVGAYTVSGAADAIVHLRAASIQHLETALERLRAVDFIDRTVSTVVLSKLLERPAMPEGGTGLDRGPSQGAIGPI
ncbi:Lrp/AsnC family transcriptional regulator [Actinoalloteichus hymeniacidonis]|nr:Lrp/AsnC family transcriptional regulator [Actinoalloteichus hymeniacidonis]